MQTFMSLLMGPNLRTFIQAGQQMLLPVMVPVPEVSQSVLKESFGDWGVCLQDPVPRFQISPSVTVGQWARFRERIKPYRYALVDKSGRGSPRIRTLATEEKDIRKIDRRGTVQRFSFESIDLPLSGERNGNPDKAMTGVDPLSAGLFAFLYGGRLPMWAEWHWARLRNVKIDIPVWGMEAYDYTPPRAPLRGTVGTSWSMVENPQRDYAYPVLDGEIANYPPRSRTEPFAGDVGFCVVSKPPRRRIPLHG